MAIAISKPISRIASVSRTLEGSFRISSRSASRREIAAKFFCSGLSIDSIVVDSPMNAGLAAEGDSGARDTSTASRCRTRRRPSNARRLASRRDLTSGRGAATACLVVAWLDADQKDSNGGYNTGVQGVLSGPASTRTHRHGRYVHSHRHDGRHRHLLLPRRSVEIEPGLPPGLHEHAHGQRGEHDHPHSRAHDQNHAHGHSHALVDRSIVRSRDGVRTVVVSLAVLGATALLQTAVFVLSGSIALLADLIHNFGDALTAIPLGIAFYVRSVRAEKAAGLFVVLTIFVSACVALYETIQRLIHPETLTHLWVVAAAGVIGFIGNEIAAQVRLRGGRRLNSPALIADGNHARTDGYVSLGVVASAVLVALGFDRADPLIGLVITLVILKITWDSWRVVSATEPGESVVDD